MRAECAEIEVLQVVQQVPVSAVVEPGRQVCIELGGLALVDGNWMEGQTKYNVNSTPTFIINGETHAGEIAYADREAMLKAAINEVKASMLAAA